MAALAMAMVGSLALAVAVAPGMATDSMAAALAVVMVVSVALAMAVAPDMAKDSMVVMAMEMPIPFPKEDISSPSFTENFGIFSQLPP